MRRKHAWYAVLVVVCMACGAQGKEREKNNEPVVAGPSANKGDPPPGNAMTLSISQASTSLKEAIRKRYVGRTRGVAPSVLFWSYPREPIKSLRVRPTGFGFAEGYVDDFKHHHHHTTTISVTFKDVEDYIRAIALTKSESPHYYVREPRPLYGIVCISDGRPLCADDTANSEDILFQISGGARQNCYSKKNRYKNESRSDFNWLDGTTAQRFAEAFNRLVYAAHHPNNEANAFSALAKAWRANPIKPPLTDEADRERILAENSIKEKNLDSAVEHYESALEIQPTWPAGWFNLAVIYGEQNSYADASDAMKHYLELVPDASDAQAARAQMIIWEDKAKH